MNLKLVLAFPLLLVTLVLPYAFGASRVDPSDLGDAVARGRYIVNSFGCVDCHSPWTMGPNGPAPDATRFLSGHPETLEMPPAPRLEPGPWLVTASATNTAWSGPWGTSFTANLTPDVETGLGSWTADDFVAALRTGRHQGRGREILPPMPFPATRNMTDADLRSIFAYLQSIPAIKNHVPAPLPPAAAQ